MKLVFKVAKNEIRNLFYSPVAWFLTIVFMVMCAVVYTLPVSLMASYQNALLSSAGKFEGFSFSLTRGFVTSLDGFGLLGSVFKNLYLFIPLLTMGLISREFNNGTFKLLYSSPVKINQIVWGKYLAIMAYNGILSLILIMFMVVASFNIKDIDYLHMLAALIAFYLVVCTYTAIGMFMSSISNYQIVSALATFLILMVLQTIGGFWQDYDFIRDLTYFLSINGRADAMSEGLITSKDVLYYVLISFLFVTFTYLRLRHGREEVSKATKVFRYSGVFVFVLLAGFISSRPGYIAYWDATRNKVNTINATTQEIIGKLDKEEPLEVTLYTNLLDELRFPKSRPSQRNYYTWKIWDRYLRFKKNIRLNYVLYYDIMDGDSGLYKMMPNMTLDSIAREMAKINNANFSQYLKPEEIRKQIDLSDEYMHSIMQLKYKGKSIYLRMYGDASFWPDETHFAAAFQRLGSDTIPKAYYSVGQLERSIIKTGEREYNWHAMAKSMRGALVNNGFEIDTLNLNYQNIPKDAHALVIADPKVELSAPVISKVSQHIDNGGNLLIMGEPGKQQIVNPLLASTGVTLDAGTLVQVSLHETPDKITPGMSAGYASLISTHQPLIDELKKKLADRDTTKWLNPGAVPVSFNESKFRVNRLWVTNPHKVWVKMGRLVTDSAAPVMDVKQGDFKLDSFTVAVSLEREINNKHQKIVVVGDADYLSNGRGPYHAAGVDYLSWMNNETYPVRLFYNKYKDDILTIDDNTADLQKIVLLFILPTAVLILGSIILIRRKRQ